MKSLRAKGLTLAIALFAATSAWAATETIAGRVVATDSANSTVTVENDAGKRMTFNADSATTMQGADGIVVKLTNVRVGDRVEVTADTADTSKLLATRIEVMDDGRVANADRNDRVANADRNDLDAREDRLPRTAGFLPLIGLVGGLAAITGFALRRVRS